MRSSVVIYGDNPFMDTLAGWISLIKLSQHLDALLSQGLSDFQQMQSTISQIVQSWPMCRVAKRGYHENWQYPIAVGEKSLFVLQSPYMSNPRNLLLYQDEPGGSLLKLIAAIVLVALLSASAYLWSSGDNSSGRALLVEAFVIGFIFWVVLPRRYQVYEDHLRIVLGVPFAVKIGFDQITTTEVTNRMALTVNFATKMTRTYVRIVKKKGLSVAITPKSSDLFVESANRALRRWQETTISTKSARSPE